VLFSTLRVFEVRDYVSALAGAFLFWKEMRKRDG